jgi:hypothetical protein
MSSQKRTIMGACDYSIATLQILKKDLGEVGNPNHELNWAIGGIIISLTSNLIKICGEVFVDAARTGEQNAKTDIEEVKNRFNEFVYTMLNQD